MKQIWKTFVSFISSSLKLYRIDIWVTDDLQRSKWGKWCFYCKMTTKGHDFKIVRNAIEIVRNTIEYSKALNMMLTILLTFK